MWKGLGCALLCLAVVQAAVIRPGADPEVPETTTSAVIRDKEGDVTTEEATTLAGPALSRDEEASILIDPAPGTLHEDSAVAPEKSGKLLLLSTTPKRIHEIERHLEEQDDEGEDNKAEVEVTTTEQPKEAAELKVDEEKGVTPESLTTESSTTAATTKLFAIDATPAGEESPPPNVAISLSQDNENATLSIAEQPQVPGDNNAAVELAIVEPEAEYVLVDGGHDDLDLQLASFTHIDSDAHLQPVVHSVEIVPTSFDDPLIVNYVHNLR
ncbi:uncharacterized protein LOC6739061 [Drosophila simulans]|uniref:GD12088 n=1 Tax=Drosophila simulans TaxID=7240 RepID=B4QKM5_DROSI|nr:uncharacterized protein LOC6739061 [Drosophila simulans]EDX11440.1 GD12088 [Drosophila simulans]KMZ01090.1 uncharacterized protein Dsimw501_GD12088 [Drosophila simulans]